MNNNSYYGSFRTRKFSDIWNTAEAFVNEYKESGLYSESNKISDENATLLYYLLYSKYGNWTIGNSDENQFKYKTFSNIFIYGPTWEKRLEIQNNLRSLSENDLLEGSKQIYNHSINPGTDPSTQDMDELQTVNDQNVNKFRRSKLDGYQFLYDLLKVDVTKSFLDRFKPLFNPFAQPQLPLWYETHEITSEEDF